MIWSTCPATTTLSVPPYITLTDGTNTPLADLGIYPGTYYQPTTVYGTSAQMPLWSSSQPQPRPTGSVWLKVGAAGTGATLKTGIGAYKLAKEAEARRTAKAITEALANQFGQNTSMAPPAQPTVGGVPVTPGSL